MKYAMRVAKLTSEMRNAEKIDVEMSDYGFLKILSRENPQYDPEYVPSLFDFINDADISKKIIMGPYGSGKTSGCVACILRDAAEMPFCDDGVRRSKWAIVRNTAGQLETTTLNTWNYWTEGLPKPYVRTKPQLTFQYQFKDSNGLICLDIIFLALDKLDDIRKLDSLELTSVYFNELRHIPKLIYDTIQSRIGRYPPKINFIQQFDEKYTNVSKYERDKIFRKWQPYIPRLLADTNPPKDKHWIADIDKEPPNKTKVYHQPPALIKNKDKKWVINEDADNLMFVSDDYYLDMIPRGEEFIKVYAQGKYGTVVDGKPVYADYNDDLHSVDDIGLDPCEPIYLGWDFGTVCPTCIVKQFSKGQVKAIKEFIGDCESVESLCEGAVKPFLNTYCKGFMIISCHDQADTCDGASQLEKCGIESEPCRSNRIEPRISCISNALTRLYKGKPFYIVSRKGCPILREALIGEYHYRRLKVIGDEKYLDVPNKIHPYSDIADADQYATMKICDDEDFFYSRSSTKQYTYDEGHRSQITGY